MSVRGRISQGTLPAATPNVATRLDAVITKLHVFSWIECRSKYLRQLQAQWLPDLQFCLFYGRFYTNYLIRFSFDLQIKMEMLIMPSVATLNKSKTLDGPLKNPQTTPGQISMLTFWEKIQLFQEKIQLFRKKVAFLRKNF